MLRELALSPASMSEDPQNLASAGVGSGSIPPPGRVIHTCSLAHQYPDLQKKTRGFERKYEVAALYSPSRLDP